MNDQVALNPNKLVRFLNKPPEEFTRKDLITFIEKNDIRMLNFRYVGGDGKLKLLNFIINDRRYLDKILAVGERVDGSSLFSYIDASASDLYVVPRYRTAFVNPFCQVPAVDVLCSYFDKHGKPLDIAPENILKKAHDALKARTGMKLEALGELEFYLSSELDKIYAITPQKGYHESHPFAKWEMVRVEAMKLISEMGGRIKYGHAEVGNIVSGDWEYVQHEIEFLPVDVQDAADQLVVAKWVIREVAYKHGLEVSFAPKIIVGHAGSGLHIHSRLVKDGKNQMVDETGALSVTAKKMIGGLLELAPSLTAFGNIVPTSYLRLVPHQEAPTNVCWGDSNRSVLVRVPLGWRGVDNMCAEVNPQEKEPFHDPMANQTVELRSADGSANVYLLLAGIAVAARRGLENPESLKLAEKLYVSVNVGKHQAHLNLPQLPASCYEAAERLLQDRAFYEQDGIFPPAMIDGLAANLKTFDDKQLSERLFGDGDALMHLVNKYLHCG
ncbi:MAG: Glutamine synthetase type I [Candidatus Ozemobacter sibiricus]|jgi:glutamine synthetase|uniref:Glutamine synthetase type I n=1 Tax=Candidatus Ozemobacter sibiricus TaxID=2268124 RepID=A0A367ZRB1_9BACT|nr:MAG: Glutamine synthetase type I [Candidatus Ozemobacter sibiricus]